MLTLNRRWHQTLRSPPCLPADLFQRRLLCKRLLHLVPLSQHGFSRHTSLENYFHCFVMDTEYWPRAGPSTYPLLRVRCSHTGLWLATESPKDVFGHPKVKHIFPAPAASSPALLSAGEATSAVLGPALGCPVQERCTPWNQSSARR